VAVSTGHACSIVKVLPWLGAADRSTTRPDNRHAARIAAASGGVGRPHEAPVLAAGVTATG
jgi:hypothetical protein